MKLVGRRTNLNPIGAALPLLLDYSTEQNIKSANQLFESWMYKTSDVILQHSSLVYNDVPLPGRVPSLYLYAIEPTNSQLEQWSKSELIIPNDK